MKRILLTTGEFTLVDDDTFEKASEFTWCLSANGHVLRTEHPPVYLVYFLFGKPPRKKEWDHKNRDPLDNQRNNLRPATKSQQSANRDLRSDNTSGFVGVTYDKRKHLWESRIWFNGRKIFLGYYKFAVEAARYRDRAAEKYFGEFARLNFPRVQSNSILYSRGKYGRAI